MRRDGDTCLHPTDGVTRRPPFRSVTAPSRAPSAESRASEPGCGNLRFHLSPRWSAASAHTAQRTHLAPRGRAAIFRLITVNSAPHSRSRSNQRQAKAQKTLRILSPPTNYDGAWVRPSGSPLPLRGITHAHGERAAVATLDRTAACAFRPSTRRVSARRHERSACTARSRHRAVRHMCTREMPYELTRPEARGLRAGRDRSAQADGT